jgi:hypothetical protein
MSDVNPNVAGSYTVVYNVRNSLGIESLPVTIIVNVINRTPPASAGAPTLDVMKGSTITVKWGNISFWGEPNSNRNYV